MAKQRLLDDIKTNPPRFYRQPSDVIRDRRFSDAERLYILRAWASDADAAVKPQIEATLEELENRMSALPRLQELHGHAGK